MEKVVNSATHLKETEMPEADAVVVFSCAGRILALRALMAEEIEGIGRYGTCQWPACFPIQNLEGQQVVTWKCIILQPV